MKKQITINGGNHHKLIKVHISIYSSNDWNSFCAEHSIELKSDSPVEHSEESLCGIRLSSYTILAADLDKKDTGPWYYFMSRDTYIPKDVYNANCLCKECERVKKEWERIKKLL